MYLRSGHRVSLHQAVFPRPEGRMLVFTVSLNKPLGYYRLILRWPTGSQTKSAKIVRKSLKTFGFQQPEALNRLHIILH
ncbi:hypothetical protein [Pantoea sp. At-9b]|uniref:hypothetical protein n=1 Tax=Pantoea sp. (strain At-9b) TaxID=592316 RepID=UPI0012379FF1|nr:hypothetical protein [Pantoea sp. At-9b]